MAPDTTQAPPRAQPPSLLPQHAKLIRESAISDEVAAERGYRSITTKADLARRGFGDKQCRVPALLIPIWDVRGEVATYQLRPDEPRVIDGRATKYETPKGTRMVLDIPPRARPWLTDPKRPLFITEGARKADAAVTVELCTIGVLGVWNWRGTNELGGKVALADWESIALKDRDVYLAFDSDIVTKSAVHAALARLKAFLESRGARVRVIYLQPGEGGTKVGLDDFLAAGGTVEQLLALARSDLLPSPDDEHSPQPYFERGGATCWKKPVGEGFVAVQLANFSARITSEICLDDGIEQTREYVIEASVGDRAVVCQVAARAFSGLNWANEHLGAAAIVSPGIGARDHLRAAIQTLSGNVDRRTVYAHTGWRDIPGVGWVYLSGAGSIGPDGPVPEITVSLPDALRPMVLPVPPTGADLSACVRATLDLLDLGRDCLSVPLVATPFRAAMGDTDFSLFSVGTTDAFKTETARLAQAFFGAGFHARNLPGAWSSTANANETLAFKAKDSLLVIDDLAPTGSRQDVQRTYRDADRVFRAQGNRAGRARLTPEGTLREGKAPRATVLATGEDLPPGHSMRARMLVLEFAKGDVDAAKLTRCQSAAQSGKYAGTMAAFIRWVAPSYTDLKAQLNARALELRQAAQRDERHRRTAAIIAELQAGFELFLHFGVTCGVIAAEEARPLRQRCWAALCSLAEAQSRHQSASDPASVFIRLLGSALGAGKAHVAGPDGEVPEEAEALGWRGSTEIVSGSERAVFRPLGLRVGWVDGSDLYLDPDAALKVAQEMGDESSRIPVSVAALSKRLFERRLLRSTEVEHGHHTVRRTVGGRRRRVLHLALGVFAAAGQPGQSGQNPPDGAPNGDELTVDWPGVATTGPLSGPPDSDEPPTPEAEGNGGGPAGPVGPVPGTSTSPPSTSLDGGASNGGCSDSLFDDGDEPWEH